MIWGIPSADYPKYRERILPFLEGFVKRAKRGETVEDYEARIGSRDAQVWVANDFQALFLTHITPEAVVIEAGAGRKREDWQDEFAETIKKWAQALGKKRIIALPRQGWVKYGKARGFKVTHVEMALEID